MSTAMDTAALQLTIERAFEDRASVTPGTTGEVRDAVERALSGLDSGELRVATKTEGATGPGSWTVHQWLKKAVLLSFRLNDMGSISGGPAGSSWYDKVPSKFEGWGENQWAAAGYPSDPKQGL